MKTKLIIPILFMVAIFISSCNNTTPVIFGINLDELNCDCTAKVYIDGEDVGIIPGSVFKITPSDSLKTLNLEYGGTEHFFEVIIVSSSSDTIGKQQGVFDVTKHDSVKIYFDVLENMIR